MADRSLFSPALPPQLAGIATQGPGAALMAVLLGAAAGLLAVGFVREVRLLVLALGGLAAIASLFRLEWGAVALVFITYTRFSDIAIDFHGAPSVAKFFVFLLLLGLGLRALRAERPVGGDRPAGWGAPVLLLGVYGLVQLASILYAADPARAQAAALDFFKDLVIVVTLLLLVQRAQVFRRVVWALLAAGLFLGSLSLLQVLTGDFDNSYGGFAQAPVLHIVGETDSHRVAGPIGDPNFYAQMLLVLVPLAVERAWNERPPLLRLLALLAAGVIVLAIVFTFSRGAFLALAATALAMVLLYRPHPALLAAALVAGLVLLRFLPADYAARMGTLTDLVARSDGAVRSEPSFRGRASELRVAWMMFTEHPFLGVGAANYPVHYLEYAERVGLDPRLEQRAAHNLYLEVASETGIAGLAAFGLILLSVYAVWVRGRRSLAAAGRTAAAGLITAYGLGLGAFLIASLFIHAAYPRYLWLLVGLALTLPRVVADELRLPPDLEAGDVLIRVRR